MSRVVPLAEGISLSELKKKVLVEFHGESVSDVAVCLSYWPPNSTELATGIMTPPVLLTNDGGIGYFFMHMKVKSPMNLFVKFDKIDKATKNNVYDGGEAGFVTPAQTKPKRSGIEEDDSFRHGYASTAGSKTHETLFDDVDLVRQVEMVEEKIVGRSGKSRVSEWSDSTVELGSEFRGSEEFDEIDVRPRGYDKEFWRPLIEDEYGGSDAFEVIYNEESVDVGTGQQR